MPWRSQATGRQGKTYSIAQLHLIQAHQPPPHMISTVMIVTEEGLCDRWLVLINPSSP